MKSIHSTRDVLIYAAPYIRGRVLDAGGGLAAKYKSLILKTAEKYTCLDSSGGGHVDVVGDVLNMPFEDLNFETVVCNQVLEHVKQPTKLIVECYRVLKPGGCLICTAPFMEPIHSDPGDFFRYTSDGLKSMFEDVGFEVLDYGKYGGFWSVFYSFIKFTFFNPYINQGAWSRRCSRYLGAIASFLDGNQAPDRIYSDSYIIAKKP